MIKKLMLAVPLLAQMAMPVWAETDYPQHPIRMVHGFAAGGNADTVARIVADAMSRDLGQPVVVEAKPGAGGNVASDFVSKADADGYTLELMVGGHAVAPALYASLPFDPLESFDFVSTVGKFPFFIAARAGTYGTLQEVIEAAKANPGSIKIGHAGVGTTQHLTGELLGLATGVKFTHIPYKGGAAASTALLGGEIDLIIDAGTVVRGQAASGDFTILAVSSKDRWVDAPDVPTVAETVAPDFDVISWTGIGLPAGVPAEIEDKLHASVVKALADPGVQERLRALGSEPAASTGAEMRAMVADQIAVWTKVVDAAGLEKR